MSWPPELERRVHAFRREDRWRSAHRLQAAFRKYLDRRVSFVLECFEGMGASEEELLEETRRLWSDKAHYNAWVLSLHSWCSVPRMAKQLKLDAERPVVVCTAPAETAE